MRGASALQTVLDAHASAPIRAFVVWEPVIATDLGPPTTDVLGRLRDARARQLWDPDRALSDLVIAAARANPKRPGTPEEIPDIAWDVVLVYAPGVVWGEEFPWPSWLGYPVEAAAPEAGQVIARLLEAR